MFTMHRTLDWKFLLTIIATVAGVAVPVLLWRADLDSRSLHFRLVSQTSLRPDGKSQLAGLQISIDGVNLESPYLSVLELSNSGSKPIIGSDFESPIELRVNAESKVVRANVTATNPKNLEAKIETSLASIKIMPLLLNPNDSITVAIITSGAIPEFASSARIAGIHAVPVVDATKEPLKRREIWFLLSFGMALLISSMATGPLAPAGKPVVLRPRAASFISITTGAIGVGCYMVFLDLVGISGVWYYAIYLLIFIAASSIIGSKLNKPI